MEYFPPILSLLSDTFLKCVCRNINWVPGKWSLHSKWNFISTFTELHVHDDERWPTEVTSNTYFRSVLPTQNMAKPDTNKQIHMTQEWKVLFTSSPFISLFKSECEEDAGKPTYLAQDFHTGREELDGRLITQHVLIDSASQLVKHARANVGTISWKRVSISKLWCV